MTDTSFPPLCARSRDILRTLTGKVRLLTLEQIARTWFGQTKSPKANAGRLHRKLERAGYLKRLNLMARPELLLSAPVLDWRPGSAVPEFGAAAYRLKSRWQTPLQSTEVVFATSAARKLVGGAGGGRRPRPAEVTHDMHLAQVYLWYRLRHPILAAGWVSEDSLLRTELGPNAKRPDAMIRSSDGRSERLVEFGGSYSKQKLAAFHQENRHLPYQIW